MVFDRYKDKIKEKEGLSRNAQRTKNIIDLVVPAFLQIATILIIMILNLLRMTFNGLMRKKPSTDDLEEE